MRKPRRHDAIRRAALGALAGGAAMRFGFLPAAVAGCAQLNVDQDPVLLDQRFQGVRDHIRRAVGEGVVPSFAVAVAIDGRIVWEQAFGYADKERRIAATPDTIYPVASVSKPIVATGLMLFLERGRISLDAPANRYLGGAELTGYAANGDSVSVRQLLQHRSGLPTHGRYFFEPEANPTPIETTIRRYAIIVAPPGERYRYSNLGYGVLAYMSSRLSGRPYAEFMREKLFEPLGMTRTSVEIGPRPSAIFAKSYDSEGRSYPYYTFDEWGSGRVFTTVRDLIRFGLFHLKALPDAPPILSDETIELMVRDRRSTGSLTGRYGLDWFYALGWGGREKSAYGPYWYGHEGGMPGVAAELKLLPEHNAVIAVVANGRSDLPAEIAREIMDAIVPGYREMRLADPSVSPAQPAAPAEPSDALVGVWEGRLQTWSGSFPLRLRVNIDGRASLALNGEAEAPLGGANYGPRSVTGEAAAIRVPLPDTEGITHHATLELFLRGDTLSGVIHALEDAPLYRVNLPSWAELHRSNDGRPIRSRSRN